MNTSTENNIRILHSIASSFSLLHIYIFSRVGNSLICSSLIYSFVKIAQIKLATVSNLLRLLRTNEQLWANCSGCSCQKSDREWIAQVAQVAQVAHDKWATMSDSLRWLMINEQMSESVVFFERITHSLFCSQKASNLLKIIWLKLYFFVLFLDVFLRDRFTHSLFFMSDVSNRSGRSPKMSKCANPSGRLPKMSDHERFAQVAHQK